jgi:hypothetical protein
MIDNKNIISSFFHDAFIIIIISILLLVSFEAIVTIFWPQNLSITYLNGKPLGLKDDILSYVNQPNSATIYQGPEFSVEYKINQDGLRDEVFHLIPKPPKTFRVLILGDSFAFGDGNDYDKIWPVIFERNIAKEWSHIDVVKAGVSGYDTRKEFLYLRRLFPRYDPDVVVLTFLPNDLFTNSPINAAGNQIASQDDNAVFSDPKECGRVQGAFLIKRQLLLNDYLYSYIYINTTRAHYFAFPWNNLVTRQIETTKDLLLETYHYCRQKAVDLIILSIPQQFQVLVQANKYHFNNLDVGHIDKCFSKFAEENGFVWISTLPELAQDYRSRKQDLYFRYDGHLNNYGNFLIGDYFAKKFLQLYGEKLHYNKLSSNDRKT